MNTIEKESKPTKTHYEPNFLLLISIKLLLRLYMDQKWLKPHYSQLYHTICRACCHVTVAILLSVFGIKVTLFKEDFPAEQWTITTAGGVFLTPRRVIAAWFGACSVAETALLPMCGMTRVCPSWGQFIKNNTHFEIWQKINLCGLHGTQSVKKSH